jgi:hypothetical protein
MVPRPRPHRGRVSFCDRVRTCRRWDCIDIRQRERAKEARFAACTSLLTSPATRRMPPKCGPFPVQPRRSPLRQTACWSKADSNRWSHLRLTRPISVSATRNSDHPAAPQRQANRDELNPFALSLGSLRTYTSAERAWRRAFRCGGDPGRCCRIARRSDVISEVAATMVKNRIAAQIHFDLERKIL